MGANNEGANVEKLLTLVTQTVDCVLNIKAYKLGWI